MYFLIKFYGVSAYDSQDNLICETVYNILLNALEDAEAMGL